jgi:hypothetical protein
MSRYTVLWRQELESELATLWINSANRQQIKLAADRIDAELLIDSHLKGDQLHENLRSLTCPPLTAYFRVDEDDRKVFVEAILLTGG